MNRLTAVLAATALLASPALALQNQPTARAYSDRLAGLTDVQRFAALRRAVLDTGLVCKKVLGAGYQGPWKNLAMWVVRCGPAPVADYGAYLGPDGSVQVAVCADVVKMKLPACDLKRLVPARRALSDQPQRR